jgi:hypothetical protein
MEIPTLKKYVKNLNAFIKFDSGAENSEKPQPSKHYPPHRLPIQPSEGKNLLL